MLIHQGVDESADATLRARGGGGVSGRGKAGAAGLGGARGVGVGDLALLASM